MRIFLSVILILFSITIYAYNKTIFGFDSRYEVFEYQSEKYKNLAEATLTMIENSKVELLLQKKPLPSLLDVGVTVYLSTSMPIPIDGKPCLDMRYVNQPAIASCSGFLVAPDTVVTAGHCVEEGNTCGKYKWVRNYKFNNDFEIDVSKSDVFECEKIIKAKNVYPKPIYLEEYSGPNYRPLPIGYDHKNTTDFAVIKLKKAVKGVPTLRLRREGRIKEGEELIVIGNPLGLPTKITDDGRVLSYKSKGFMLTDIDCFKGNSGSVVFNYSLGIVEGILVSSGQPFKKDRARGCFKLKSNTVDDIKDEMNFSGVTPIGEVLPFL